MLKTRDKTCGRPYGWPHPTRNHWPPQLLGRKVYGRDKASLSGRHTAYRKVFSSTGPFGLIDYCTQARWAVKAPGPPQALPSSGPDSAPWCADACTSMTLPITRRYPLPCKNWR